MNTFDKHILLTLRNDAYVVCCIKRQPFVAFHSTRNSDSISYNMQIFVTYRTSSETIAKIRHLILFSIAFFAKRCKLADFRPNACVLLKEASIPDDECLAQTFRFGYVLKLIVWNARQNKYSPHIFEHKKKPTNNSYRSGYKRSQTHPRDQKIRFKT